jgi:hypothetical protein
LTTHARFSCEKFSASPIDGRATFTIDASSTTMNWAKQRSINAVQRRSMYSWASVMA